MLEYFFVPGTKLRNLAKIEALNVDEIIIDLEDAVKFSERGDIINTMTKGNYTQNFVRIPLYNWDFSTDLSIMRQLVEGGYRKFVFPKLQSIADLDKIFESFNEVELDVILLVESPRFLIELGQNIFKYEKQIAGLSLGSHDFISEIGAKYNLHNLELPRQQIMYLARSINTLAIDIASMELSDRTQIVQEIKDGFDKGYDAKFYIHPWQIEQARSIKFYTEELYLWAQKVVGIVNEVGGSAEFNPIVIDGQIIERPHLRKAIKIIQTYEGKQPR